MVRRAKESSRAEVEHENSHIVVTAQQSRYALDAVEAPASKEVCPSYTHTRTHDG